MRNSLTESLRGGLVPDSNRRSFPVDGAILAGAVNLCFPEKWILVKSTDKPWLNQAGRRAVKRRKRFFKRSHLIPKKASLSSLSEVPGTYHECSQSLWNPLYSTAWKMKPQFKGINGVGADLFLIDMWQDILEGLEENRGAVNVLSIDIEKAFNWLNHAECIKASRDVVNRHCQCIPPQPDCEGQGGEVVLFG